MLEHKLIGPLYTFPEDTTDVSLIASLNAALVDSNPAAAKLTASFPMTVSGLLNGIDFFL